MVRRYSDVGDWGSGFEVMFDGTSISNGSIIVVRKVGWATGPRSK